MDNLQVEAIKTLRAVILKVAYDNHAKQFHRLSLIPLGGFLERMRYDVTLNELRTVLQDLKERGYLNFEESKERNTGRVDIQRITITPLGRDVVEGTVTDAAVRME